ncbi:DUF4397 domain-containing protein [Subtercola boreus]|nr:DUF4397 domain-containing protein [Subtercola boreus]
MTLSPHFDTPRWARWGALATLAGAAAALIVGGVGVSAASAAETSAAPSALVAGEQTAPSTTGWVRLAHLSPDTTAVDVQLSALAGGTVVTSLKDIGYGAVSSYMALPAGTYVVAMVPSGGAFASPVISATISVVAGEPQTVAAYGKNASLATAVFQDDLAAPGAGQSRVRVVQASTIVPTVNVSTSTGTAIASNAKEGTATTYANVPAGQWKLSLTSPTVTSSADVNLVAGSVSTLFVLDDASGGLALKAVLDSSSVGDLPTGGIQTGAGGTATQHIGTTATPTETAADSTTSASDTTRRAIDEVTGWAFLAAGLVAVLLIRRRDARSSAQQGSDGRNGRPGGAHPGGDGSPVASTTAVPRTGASSPRHAAPPLEPRGTLTRTR